MDKYKYAIVRIPESSVIEFFSIIAAKGYSDVSFVSNLSQVTLRPDPNDLSDATPSSSAKVDERVIDDDASHSSSVCGLSTETMASEKKPKITVNAPLTMPPLLISNPKTEPSEVIMEESVNAAELLANAMPTDILNNLFGKVPNPFSIGTEWNTDVGLVHNNHVADVLHHPYRNETGSLQTRMKGWQREYIKEVINNGHYPTENELREIEQKCDLSRKQVLRFIAKRLVNPNRKPRVNHLVEKKKEKEEREAREASQTDSGAEINDFA